MLPGRHLLIPSGPSGAGRSTLAAVRFRYSRWDGTQDPFGPDLSAGELLEAMSEELLSGQGADQALARLLRQGLQGRFTGLDALRARLRQARRREQEHLNLEGPLREVQERLDDIVETERRALSFRAEDDARFREQFLEALHPDPAGAIRELKEYRFVDPEAQGKFDLLMEWLHEQVMGSYFRSMAEGLRNLSRPSQPLARAPGPVQGHAGRAEPDDRGPGPRGAGRLRWVHGQIR
jgi:uncharacterized protein with von Willebrand factor type A (vWA) domain